MKTLFNFPKDTFTTAEEMMRAIAAAFSDTFGWETEEETDASGGLAKITIYVDNENGTGMVLDKSSSTVVIFHATAKESSSYINLGDNFSTASQNYMYYEKSKDGTAVLLGRLNSYFTVAETTTGAKNIICIYSGNYFYEIQGEQRYTNGGVQTTSPAIDTISLTPMLSGFGGAYKELYYVRFSSLNEETKPLYYQKDGHKFVTNNNRSYRYAMRLE